ncbi:hypothetical protein CHLRE_10g420000v5 [Chlamydomonas reinhardtii]|uniref:Uncharacterized protein n=1 Tax=Chlamydomonas reinhardtii TaxID=3055 RepID=A0A2K3D943_CHLRE|nr:uncharacterized protein CHLRE_10g420000v5 [Chlamydomonas reinhardtii]PNW77045.1 hypothetical protein CHLRE_10g420000v5 [Chlamydomonas reinhardtii]
MTTPNMVFETAYSQRRRDLERVMCGWLVPSGPALVVVGVDIQYPHPPRTPPRVEVLLQLSREARAGAAVHCGAGSGCVSPVMYDHTLWVPVDRLLRGAPWTTRLLACLCLACLVPLYSVLWGGRYALEDVLTGRRRLLDVASASVRSLGGPWWGAVPLDAYVVRAAVFQALGIRPDTTA